MASEIGIPCHSSLLLVVLIIFPQTENNCETPGCY